MRIGPIYNSVCAMELLMRKLLSVRSSLASILEIERRKVDFLCNVFVMLTHALRAILLFARSSRFNYGLNYGFDKVHLTDRPRTD